MRRTALVAVLFSLALPAHASVAYDAKRNILVLSGRIGGDDHCQAVDLLIRHPGVTSVHINSAGGDAWAGAQLGRVFGYAGLDATIPRTAQALSAAGVAALGARTLRVQGHLGLHGPYASLPAAPFASLAVAQARAEMRDVLEDAGLPPAQVSMALAIAPDRFLTITQQAVNERQYRMRVDRQRLVALRAACGALAALLGSPVRNPT